MKIMQATDNRITEILDEIEKAEFDNEAKKALASKYGISSRKMDDIKKHLFDVMDSYRKEHSQFTVQDWVVWNKKFNFPFSYKKIKEACEGEPIEWVDFCISMTQKKAYPKDNRNSFFMKLKNEIEKSKDGALNAMVSHLSIVTFPFKEKLYKNLISFETKRFKYFSQFSDVPEEKKEDKAFIRNWATIKVVSNGFDFDAFKKRVDDEFESMFSSNISSVAERLLAKGISHKGLALAGITEDPKFFEMVLKDNSGNTIWCRSIIAAEFSSLVRAHYRFITTIKHSK